MRATAQLFPNTGGAVIRNPWALLPLFILFASWEPPARSIPTSRAASSRWPGLAWAGDGPGTRGAWAGARDLMRRAWRVPSRGYRMMEGFHLAALPWHSRWTAIKAKNIRLNVRSGFHPRILTGRQIHLPVNFVCSQTRRAPPGWARDVARGRSRRGDPEAGTHPAAQGGDAEGQSHPEPPAQAASTGPSPFLSISQTIS